MAAYICEEQAWLALMSSSNELQLTFVFWVVSCELLVILELKLLPPLAIIDSY